jgi:hypothetical protein
MMTAWRSGQTMLPKLVRTAFWPVTVYIFAYTGTTVIGAIAVLTPFGQDQARIFLPDFAPERMQTLGSALYLAVLFAPLLVVPAFALIGLRAGDVLSRGFPQFKVADPSTRTLYGLMAIFVGWCLYKLAVTGYLVPDVMLDQSKTCADRIIRRVELLAQLHYTFYAFAYAALPLVSVMFLVKGIRDHKAADLAGFVVSFVVIFYLYATIYMKAPFAIYFLVMLVGLLAAGLRWWKVFAVIGCLASVTLYASHIALGCTAAPSRPLSAPPPLSSPPSGTARAPSLPSLRPPSALELQLQLSTRAQVVPLVRNLVFRMALSFPYYMEVFKDPTERCGVEDNRIPFIPKQTCFPASKVFSAMYPSLTYVQGQAPASAHASAIAELGPWFAFVVMIAAGLAIGITSQLARHCGPVLRIGIIAAVSVFAYNLTQVPFVGALTYSQGFIVFLFTVVLIVASQRVLPAFSTAATARFGKQAVAMPGDALMHAASGSRDVVGEYLGLAATETATSSMALLWRSANLAVRRVSSSAAKIPLVIWAGAATIVIVAFVLAATSSFRDNTTRIDSNATAVARGGVRLDTEAATIDAVLREVATIRQQLESLIQTNARLADEISNLKGELEALKRARSTPRAASGHWKRRR